MLRPCVLYDEKLHLESMHQETEDKIHVAVNESLTRMMDPFVFTQYFKEELNPKLVRQKVRVHSFRTNNFASGFTNLFISERHFF